MATCITSVHVAPPGHVVALCTLTSIEQPSSDPRSRAFVIMRGRSLGADFSSYISDTPPVKSSKPSVVEPPDRASYEPFSLERKTHIKKTPKNGLAYTNTLNAFTYKRSLLSVGFLQQGAPELGPFCRVHENELPVFHGQTVVDDDVHPVAELPELHEQNNTRSHEREENP